MSEDEKLQSLLHSLHSPYTNHHLHDPKKFPIFINDSYYLCLAEDWKNDGPQKVTLKGYSFSGGKTQDSFKVIPIASSPIEFLENLIEIKSDQDFELDLKNLFQNVSFKKGDLIGIAKLPTETEIAEFKRKKDAEIAELKRKKDAEMNRQISLDLSKETSTNPTPIVTTKVLPVSSSSKKSSSHLVAKKLSKIATKELFKPDLITDASKKQGKTTSQKEKQLKDSNNEKENQKEPKNDQNSQKKNDSKTDEKVEKSSTVQEEQTPAVFIDYKSHPKFNEELQNFENTLQAQCSKIINPIWKFSYFRVE